MMINRNSPVRSGRPWPRRRRATALALGATVLGLATTTLVSTPAFAESVTSPTGMVTVSVPPGVQAGIASTYTLTVTNTGRRHPTGQQHRDRHGPAAVARSPGPFAKPTPQRVDLRG
jgi:hypothetical protein